MITRRDGLVALLTLTVTLSVVGLAQTDTSLMTSSIFDWNSIEAKPTKLGSTRKFFQAPTATLDELECHVTTLNPGETPHPPHKHPDEELIIVKEGTVESLVNGQIKRVGPGSVIFQASNQMHSIRNIGQTPATYHVIKWNSPGMLKAKPKP
jgi:quercetin dioxygenase-like cupin family protein